MKEQGFTLIELVITIVLVAILATFAVSQFSFDATRLDLAEDKLVGDLEYAKRLALTTGTTYGIFFEPALERYTVFEGTVATPVSDPANRSQSLIIDYNDEVSFEGVDLLSALFEGNATVYFNGTGAPVDAGGNALFATGTVVLVMGTQARSILVSPNTGKVTTL